MKKREFRKRMYVSPAIKIIETEMGCALLNGSKINGGHNPGTIAPPISGAKQGFFDEDEGEEERQESEWGSITY